MAQDSLTAIVTGEAVVPVPVPTASPFTADENDQLAKSNELVRKRICENFDLTIKFSEAACEMLHWAWMIAAQLQHSQVTEHHVIVALLSNDDPTALALAEAIDFDRLSLIRGALARVADLPKAQGPQKIEALRPTTKLRDWIDGASRLASEHGLVPLDLVTALADPTTLGPAHRTISGALSRANTDGELFRARRSIVSDAQTLSRFRYETGKQFNAFGAKVAAIAAQSGNLSEIRELVSQLRSGYPAEFGALNTNMSSHFGGIGKGLDAIEGRVVAVADRTEVLRDASSSQSQTLASLAQAVNKLDQQNTAMLDRMPRPPSAKWLCVAIPGALAFGGAIGMLLSPTGFANLRALFGG
jgi:hypothetical protein